MTVTIGPGGERQLGAAGIVMTDANGEPFRLAARGGLGAVMGSKGLKAILIRRIPDAAKPPASGRSAIVGFHKLVAPSARVQTLRQYGTASTLNHTQHLGGLPTRNFSEGQFEGAEAIGGEALRDTILARGGVGTPTEACMTGCVIQCSNIFADAEGKLSVAPLEFETLGLCGSNLGLDSLGRHRPHQPGLQRSGPGHHRDRRGAGRDDGGRRVWRTITPQSTHRMRCRVSETASARRRSSPASNTAIR